MDCGLRAQLPSYHHPAPAIAGHSMSPPDLPGFYWDSLKNRYFPLSSRPPPEPPAPQDDPQDRRQRHPWRAFQAQRESHDATLRCRTAQSVLTDPPRMARSLLVLGTRSHHFTPAPPALNTLGFPPRVAYAPFAYVSVYALANHPSDMQPRQQIIMARTADTWATTRAGCTRAARQTLKNRTWSRRRGCQNSFSTPHPKFVHARPSIRSRR